MKFHSKDSQFTPDNPSPLASKLSPEVSTSLLRLGDELSFTKQSPHTVTVEQDDSDDDMEPKNPSVPPEFLSQLATFPLFKQAPQSFLSKIATKLTLLSVHPQQYIVKKGEPATAMYWILKGTVAVTSTDGESVYAELMPGSFFGEIGTLYNRPRTATVITRTRVLVAVLTARALNTVLKNYPSVERRIRDEAQERLAMQEKRKIRTKPSLNHQTTLKSPSPRILPSPYPKYDSSNKTYMRGFENQASRSLILDPLGSVDGNLSIQEFIKQLPFFATLPADIIHEIALHVDPLTIPPFKCIFKKGDIGSNIYFIVHGEVEVIDYNENMHEKRLGRLTTSDYFGEMTFLAYLNSVPDITRSATVRSITTVELIVVKSEQLQELCVKYPFIIDQMKQTADSRFLRNKNNETKARLSIDYLINGTACDCNDTEQKLQPNKINEITIINDKRIFDEQIIEKRKHNFTEMNNCEANYQNKEFQNVESNNPNATLYQPKPLFSSSWNFNPKYEAIRSRSISPISPVSQSPKNTAQPPLKKLPSVYDEDAALALTLPPLNPPSPSLNNFYNPNFPQEKKSFQYLPLNKRIRLASVGGRRRSSVLSVNGFLPDKVLIRVFEYLQLPELMKLRIVSRRWRQLLNVAPNLCKVLDLTPWNTSISDKALIQITDFVGSRPRYINTSNCFHITDEGFSYMVNEIGIAGKIQSLKMKSNWEVSAMAIMDLTAPSVGKFLEELDLSNCRKVRDDVLIRLLGWDGNAPQNDPLEIDYEFDRIGCKNLKILNISYCKHVTDKFMLHLANNASKRLESLDLTRCTTISDKGFNYWTYNSFPNLKKLSLKDCTFITDESIISLTSAAPNLEILDLNFCCALSDVAIEVICMGCQNIRELDLSFCGSAVSDSSLVAISLQLQKLERLIVRGCIRVTRAGVDALLSGCAPLNFIDISQCKNAHVYPEGVPAQTLNINPHTKSAFVIAGTYQNVIEIAI